jgi:heat shock protein HtpX
MASLYTHRDINIRKTFFLMSAFFVFVIALGWLFSYVFDSPGILYFAVVFSIILNVVSYWYSDKIVLAMTGARLVNFQDNPELHRIVENLAITAGLPKPRIYLVNEDQPNAFATGRNPDKAAIALTRGLLERLDRSELEGVLAHELSHIGNRDILVSTVAVILAGVVAMLSDIFIRSLWWSRLSKGRDRDAGTALVFILAVMAAILAPIAAALLRLAVSRKREFLADASGALLTRYPEGLARALEKISADSHAMKIASSANSHLWIESPIKGQQRNSWFRKLFMTHPAIEERIKALRGLVI